MRSSCPVCRGGSSRLLEPAEPPHRVLHCPACDVAFVDPFPDRAALQRRYGPGYYAAWISRQKSRRARMWDARLRFLEGVAGRGRLLDVGCGDGAFLEQARRRGWEVAGTEISSWAAAHAAATLGRAVFCGELREAAYPEAHFDAVTLWHVLEHVTEPLSLLEEVRRILKPRGVLIVAVPNRNDRVMQAAYRLVKRRRPKLFSLRDREPHLFHFSAASLTRLVALAGFAVAWIGPDSGIVEPSKRLVNGAAVVLSRLLHRFWWNAILLIARKA